MSDFSQETYRMRVVNIILQESLLLFLIKIVITSLWDKAIAKF